MPSANQSERTVDPTSRPMSTQAFMLSTAARRIFASAEQIDPNLYCGSVKRFGLMAPMRIPCSVACRCRSDQSGTLSHRTWTATAGVMPVNLWTWAASETFSYGSRGAAGSFTMPNRVPQLA